MFNFNPSIDSATRTSQAPNGCSCESYVSSYPIMAEKVVDVRVVKKPRKKVLDELNGNNGRAKTVCTSSGKRSQQGQNQNSTMKKVCMNEAFVNAGVINEEVDVGENNSSLVDQIRSIVDDQSVVDTGSSISSPATFADFVMGREASGNSDASILLRNFNFAIVDKSMYLFVYKF